MRIRSLSLLLVTFLIGCSPQHYIWSHNPPLPLDTSQQKTTAYQLLSSDWVNCVALGNQGSTGYTADFGGQMMSLASSINLRDTCMYGKGWIRKSETSGPTKIER